ncbi:MAG: zf-HC2 domain-containing protein [bacterium]
MSACEQYEIEFSALLDGESSTAQVVELLDHLVQCPACREFYQELRSFQDLVDDLPDLAELPAQLSLQQRLQTRAGIVPRWARGLAAVFLFMVGVVGITTVSITEEPDLANSPIPATITLEENRGQMNDDRFLEIVTELLQAGRQYHDEMAEILKQIQRPTSADEIVDRYAIAPDEGSNYENRSETIQSAQPLRIVN